VNKPDVYYRALGLKPGASREEVKRAYRKLVKIWHPDRFFQDADLLQQQALEKIKDINYAYDKLRALRPRFKTRTVPTTPQTPRAASDQQQNVSPRTRTTIPTWLMVSIAFIILRLLSAYTPLGLPLQLDLELRARSSLLWWSQRASKAPAAQNSLNTHTTFPLTLETAESEGSSLSSADQVAQPMPYFTIGSTKDEVLAIQGPPSLASEHVWEYGGSRVYFRNGRVTHWDVWSNSPLKAQLRPTTATNTTRGYFTVGSTKDEVLAIQGTPTRFTNRVWEYGLSRVYFDDDRVTRWEEWPRDPLKAKLVPSTATNTTRGYFTVGSTKDEVLAIQGTPTRFTDRVWEYGLSRVYFDDDRVTRWEEWRGSPLKARLTPLDME
jgi:outer membrane protein assembly factor BamE (lipoprotein component of BamABCDE complex)